MSQRGLLKRIAFAAVPSIVGIVVVAWAYLYLFDEERVRLEGLRVNQRAWRQTYLDRGQTVPPDGPREGFWGAGLLPKVSDEDLGWRDAKQSRPGMFEVDAAGMQHFVSRSREARRVVVIGASVAWGAYASREEITYFHRLGIALEKEGVPAHIDVLAAGAWKSVQELAACRRVLSAGEVDLVVFFNGLNDLTCGANADALYGEVTETRDGSRWTELYHEHDYSARVTSYLEQMKRASELVDAAGAEMLVFLQPALTEQNHPTEVERELLEMALRPHASSASLTDGYERIRQGLSSLEQSGRIHFIDLSRALADERHTTFADLWHFTDRGHEVVVRLMVEPVARLLGSSEE